MAVFDINTHPSPHDLRWFGRLLPIFVAIFGAVLWWRTGSAPLATGIWIGGGALSLGFALWAASRRPIFVAWMYAVAPIGWAVSHLLLGAVYFGVITPIGLALRVLRRDPLERRFDPAATTYWVPHVRARGVSRYLRQF